MSAESTSTGSVRAQESVPTNSVRPEPVEGPPAEVLAYVKATAVLMKLPLDEARAQRVAGHLAISAEMARQLETFPLAESDELVAIYCPAPFPSSKGGLRKP
jgi:hypothetical protein